MRRTVAIGIQSFEKIRENNYFYIDKTGFIKEWWESGDDVTLITRPRRFGKTLNMSMLEQFFSIEYANRGDLFEGLSIWEEEKYRELQGTYPVISLSFARVKECNYITAKAKICEIISDVFRKYSYIKDSDVLSDSDKVFFKEAMSLDMKDNIATSALHKLSDFLYRYYGKKAIILLDEYDTPMQESYVYGFWKELVQFTRSMFNSTFKTNPYLHRAVMTGITRVSKESIFSDLNNLKVVTSTSDKYAKAFGFTEEEVFAGLEECGLEMEKEMVKNWYDGFTFGHHMDIYNPWSVLNFLATGKYETYWANSSSNGLINKLMREGSKEIKLSFEKLLKGESIVCPIDEQIVYEQLDTSPNAIWSLLLATGYLKVLHVQAGQDVLGGDYQEYELAVTNHEVRRMLMILVTGWFRPVSVEYHDFITALLQDDVDTMNICMNRLSLNIFSYFDVGNRPSGIEPERFYHGFVLGLLVGLQPEYLLTSNRESGFGRYDIMIEPKNKSKKAFIIEFKVMNPRREKDLEETLEAALNQIESKRYEDVLIERGFVSENIRKYGFAFRGKEVLIG